MTLRLVTDNTRDWLADIQRDNELRFYIAQIDRLKGDIARQFDRGYRKGFWAGSVFWAVCGMWISVAFALLWTVLA